MGNSRNSCRQESGRGEGNSRTTSRAVTNAEEREAATQLSREVADGNRQAGGDVTSARDLMDDDVPSSALKAFKALHHPVLKAAERLLITDGLVKSNECKMLQNGHLINNMVTFMPVLAKRSQIRDEQFLCRLTFWVVQRHKRFQCVAWPIVVLYNT